MIRAPLFGAMLLAMSFPRQAEAQDAPAEVPVAVLAAPVARGARLNVSDFLEDVRPVAVARGALAPGDAAGKEALRNLAAGAVVRAGDIGPPQLVRRGEPVTVRYATGGLVIAGTGRALANGGEGDPVRVVLTATSRTLDAIVDGPGTVRLVAPRLETPS